MSDIKPFYSHRGPDGWLSNFYKIDFPYCLPSFVKIHPNETVHVNTSEQAIMLTKAALFGDEKVFKQLQTPNVSANKCKTLGRSVKPFDETVWNKHRWQTAIHVLSHKFQVPEMKKKLLATGTSILAEASLYDTIWGVGLRLSDPNVYVRSKWRGDNVLGYSLMAVRTRLSKPQTKLPSTTTS